MSGSLLQAILPDQSKEGAPVPLSSIIPVMSNNLKQFGPSRDQMQKMWADRNSQWSIPGNYNTALPPSQEMQFRGWLKQNNVPFDVSAPVTDYDMRGFYLGLQNKNPIAVSAIDPNDSKMHYPDYWKTPLHETFSDQSQWATPGAPAWNNQDQLVGKNGAILFDDRAPRYGGGF